MYLWIYFVKRINDLFCYRNFAYYFRIMHICFLLQIKTRLVKSCWKWLSTSWEMMNARSSMWIAVCRCLMAWKKHSYVQEFWREEKTPARYWINLICTLMLMSSDCKGLLTFDYKLITYYKYTSDKVSKSSLN